MKKNLLQPNALLTLLLGIFLMLITARSFARQSTPISGQVKDASSGEPLPGVSVFLKGGTTHSTPLKLTTVRCRWLNKIVTPKEVLISCLSKVISAFVLLLHK